MWNDAPAGVFVEQHVDAQPVGGIERLCALKPICNQLAHLAIERDTHTDCGPLFHRRVVLAPLKGRRALAQLQADEDQRQDDANRSGDLRQVKYLLKRHEARPRVPWASDRTNGNGEPPLAGAGESA